MLKTEHPAFNMNRHSSQNELQSKMTCLSVGENIARIAMHVGSKQTAWHRTDWFIWRYRPTLHCRCRWSSSGAFCG